MKNYIHLEKQDSYLTESIHLVPSLRGRLSREHAHTLSFWGRNFLLNPKGPHKTGKEGNSTSSAGHPPEAISKAPFFSDFAMS